ncbi:SseB family protein [Micromonospora siamensis]|uniref:SseB family protein n=1 Tax=Micromonospora siamensis TaxID=299152 RepID=UPI000B5AE14E|nr:SseB family protein [Micromonospora siamensis]
MTDWEPATEAEAAMRDALSANDQELYFRVLARTDLLLPVSGQPAPGQSAGWGTWTTSGRTHVLAFTSPTALRACLGDSTGPTRRAAYADLADDWPNHEWWLAVNPGLPIEGYLPAWFVTQLSRGEVRLPGRTMGARARLERAESLARARANAVDREAPRWEPASPPAPPTSPVPPTPLARRESDRTGPSPVPAPLPGPAPEPADQTIPVRAAASRGSAVSAFGSTGEPPSPPAVEAARPGVAPTRPGPSVARPDGRPEPSSIAAANGGWPDRPGDEAAARSFFEPSAQRRAAGEDARRPAERAVPPSRLGRVGQPFPRRRPISEPVPAPPVGSVPEEPTQAFRVPVADDGLTQVFPRRAPEPPAEEATQVVRAGVPDHDLTVSLPRRTEPPTEKARFGGGERAAGPLPRRHLTEPGPDEQTQRLAGPHPYAAAGQPAPPVGADVDELPPSIAEPVSAPPVPRRSLSPIVIEGTVIESRDLGEAGPAVSPVPADRPVRTGPPAANANANGAAWATPARPAEPPTLEVRAAEPAPAVAEPSAPAVTPVEPAVEGVPEARIATPAAPATVPDPPVTAATAYAPPSEAPAPETTPSAPASPVAPATSPVAPVPSATAAPATTPGSPVVPAPAASPVAPVSPAPATTPAPPAPAASVPPAPAPAVPASPRPTAPSPQPAVPAPAAFTPANEVEEELLASAGAGNTDGFLSTLLLARVLLPVAPGSAPGSRPGEPGFVWHTEQLDGGPYVVVWTSAERMADAAAGSVETVLVRFVQLIRRWPDRTWSFAVNPGTPVGAKLPGEQIVGLANWAADVGLGDEPETEPAAAEEPANRPRVAPPVVDPTRPIVMQKAVAPSQLAYYLERGYDRVSGFVHRAGELAHLHTPTELYDALGLGYPGSPFDRAAGEIYVLRWPAHRPSLYRIPYGGQNEVAMRAMEGWVIERAPFRGNGFAPGESSDVVAEFKVDSARLPHGAQLWRIGADGAERVVAVLDTDVLLWRQVGEDDA